DGKPRRTLGSTGGGGGGGGATDNSDDDDCGDDMVLVSAKGTTFCMDINEVTVDDYAACAKAKSCDAAPTTVGGSNLDNAPASLSQACNAGKDGRGKHAINCVTQAQAIAYCKYAKKRLPSESEWLLAATGGGARKYPWGDDAPDSKTANLCGSE